MATLLQETLNYMQFSEKTPEDVAWVGNWTGKFVMAWSSFAAQAHGIDAKGVDIGEDLVVVFKDKTWMQRWEADGRQGWELIFPPVMPTDAPVGKLVVKSAAPHSARWLKIEKAE